MEVRPNDLCTSCSVFVRFFKIFSKPNIFKINFLIFDIIDFEERLTVNKQKKETSDG